MGGSHGSFQKQGMPIFKIVVLGEQGCGKSTIIGRYISNRFIDTPPPIADPPPTALTPHTIHLPSHGAVGVVFWEIAATSNNLIRTEQCQNSNAAIVAIKSSVENIDSRLSLWKQTAQDLVGATVPLLILINCFQGHPGIVEECQLVEQIVEQEAYIVRPTSGEDQNINKVINQFLGRLIPKPYPVGEHM